MIMFTLTKIVILKEVVLYFLSLVVEPPDELDSLMSYHVAVALLIYNNQDADHQALSSIDEAEKNLKVPTCLAILF